MQVGQRDRQAAGAGSRRRTLQQAVAARTAAPADRTINSKDFNALWRRLPSHFPMQPARQAANLCLGTVFALPFGSLFICRTASQSQSIPSLSPSRQSPPAAVCLACNLSLNAPDLTAANTFGFPSPAVKELPATGTTCRAIKHCENWLTFWRLKSQNCTINCWQTAVNFPLSPPRHIDTSTGNFGESAN